jgi:hypothetical protein
MPGRDRLQHNPSERGLSSGHRWASSTVLVDTPDDHEILTYQAQR